MQEEVEMRRRRGVCFTQKVIRETMLASRVLPQFNTFLVVMCILHKNCKRMERFLIFSTKQDNRFPL